MRQITGQCCRECESEGPHCDEAEQDMDESSLLAYRRQMQQEACDRHFRQ
jgi:hypothetical protein